MPRWAPHKLELKKQYVYSIGLVLSVALICYGLTPWMGYRVVALVLLLTVSITAISFRIFPVLVAATLSAFIWDFFFIPPHFTIHVDSTEDAILLIMYFIIALVNAVLTYKIRQVEKLARLREEKANAVKLYNTFLNSLSHELKTPIAAIIGATDNLQQSGHQLSEAHKAQLVEEISVAGLRLNRQVENLLHMSRIESGFLKPRRDWCDVGETIYQVVHRLADENAGRKINIHVHPQLPLCRLDNVLLETVLYNLLLNALKYTEAPATVTVMATHYADVLELKVEDNGPGFPPEEVPYIFNKFYRLKETNKSGTGLGLSIVKGFTEAMGGTVELVTPPGGGASFVLRFPLEKNEKN